MRRYEYLLIIDDMHVRLTAREALDLGLSLLPPIYGRALRFWLKLNA